MELASDIYCTGFVNLSSVNDPRRQLIRKTVSSVQYFKYIYTDINIYIFQLHMLNTRMLTNNGVFRREKEQI